METPTQQWPEGVLVVTPAADTKSPLWRKMWQRAGYDPAVVHWLDLAHFAQEDATVPPDAHQLIVLGEGALARVCG